ncbi:hypothetical protein [Bauldia sp.]|uniref:hypothetical protein n=1 Tax=Bauldia sp. TaxID=2575872 RepID=UPI003BA92E39
MSVTDGATASSGLPWPESYRDILPVLNKQWGVTGQIYLNRQLGGGRSGALVFTVDIECEAFAGQAILKLDEVPDPDDWLNAEAELHRQAIADAPEFAAAHLPKLIQSLLHGHQVAVLSTVAARGLEYVEPWISCAYDRQLSVVKEFSRGILDDWNKNYRLSDGIYMPTDLLRSWLGHRLEPERGGRLGDFMDESGLSLDIRSVVFEGHWLPNPIAFAVATPDLPERLQLRGVKGHCHCDLHGNNVLVGRPLSPDPTYYLIDLAMYESDQFLFYDHAYFEIATLLAERGDASQEEWNSLLHALSHFGYPDDDHQLRADDLGLLELIRALRKGVTSWIDRRESNRLSFLTNQYLLARVAAGLNFTHKRLPLEARKRAFTYAASNLKDYCKHNRLDWPKDGPPFALAAPTPPIAAPGSAMSVTSGAIESASSQPMANAASTNPVPPATDALPSGANEGGSEPGGLAGFFGELRRRHVVRVAGIYVVVAWLCLQVVLALETTLRLPDWTDTLVTVLLAIGLPIAAIMAWAYERTPDGLERTGPAPPGKRDTGSGMIDYVALVGIVAVVGLTAWQLADRYALSDPTGSADGRTSIAVLPFKNLSDDSDDQTFSDGLSIEIMNTLARAGSFRVPGRTSTFLYRDQPDDLRAIGETLGVEYILEGSVRRFENQLRVEAQLVQADDGFLVWSNVYEYSMGDIFVVQQQIANAIGVALEQPLGIDSTVLEDMRTSDPRAYGLYLAAIPFLDARGESLVNAMQLLQESVAIDPEFAAGWAALSIVYSFVPLYVDTVDGREVIPAVYYRNSQHAATQAESLDPTLPIVEQAVGNVYLRNRLWRAAEDEYRSALTSDPSDHRVMKEYSQLLAVVGYHDQAIAMAEEMRALDPENEFYDLLQALYEWQAAPSETGLENLEYIVETSSAFRASAMRRVIGYRFGTGEIDQLRSFVATCAACPTEWRDNVLALIDAAETQDPETFFEENRDDVLVGYRLLNAIGGLDLLIEAFRYYSLDTNRRIHLSLLPWNLVDVIGDDPQFKSIIRDMGLVTYWQERGWPDQCRPVGEDDFTCG